MSFRRLLRYALLNLVATRQRTVLAVLGIGIGVAAVIAMVSLGAIARAEAVRQFQLLGTDLLSLSVSREPRRLEGFSLADAMSIPSRIPLVRMVAPRVETSFEVRSGTFSDSLSFFGVTPNEMVSRRLRMAEGRFLTTFDGDRAVCVLGADLAAQLASQGGGVTVGGWLNVQGQLLAVIGILAKRDVGTYGDARTNQAVYVPIAWALRRQSSADVPAATLQIAPDVLPATAAVRIAEALTRWKGDSVTFEVSSPEELLKQMEQQLRLYTTLLGIIASISLVVGGVGVMNIMLIAVIERRKEIGVRRALGARKRDIQAQFLVESVVLTVAGGLAGILIGVAAAWVVASRLHWQPFIPMTPVWLGFTVAVVLGLFFGWYPSRRAASLLPIEAMRT